MHICTFLCSLYLSFNLIAFRFNYPVNYMKIDKEMHTSPVNTSDNVVGYSLLLHVSKAPFTKKSIARMPGFYLSVALCLNFPRCFCCCCCFLQVIYLCVLLLKRNWLNIHSLRNVRL